MHAKPFSSIAGKFHFRNSIYSWDLIQALCYQHGLNYDYDAEHSLKQWQFWTVLPSHKCERKFKAMRRKEQ